MKIKWKDSILITSVILIASLFLLQSQQGISVLTTSTRQNALLSSFPIFVIDAGHGGEDGGAIGRDGTEEKNINLAISEHLRDFSEIFGFQSVMIRETDCDLSDNLPTIRERKISDIKKRTEITNHTENAVYIGIHQNFYESSISKGMQVFYANEENASKDIAFSIQSYTATVLQKENHRQVKNAGSSIYILTHTVQPAVMVECGFMSNEEELTLLCTKQYRQSISFCIFMGLFNYFTTEVDL